MQIVLSALRIFEFASLQTTVSSLPADQKSAKLPRHSNFKTKVVSAITSATQRSLQEQKKIKDITAILITNSKNLKRGYYSDVLAHL